MPIILSLNKQKKIKSIKKKMIDLDLNNADISIWFSFSTNKDYVTKILNGNCYVAIERLNAIYDALDAIHAKKYKVAK